MPIYRDDEFGKWLIGEDGKSATLITESPEWKKKLEEMKEVPPAPTLEQIFQQELKERDKEILLLKDRNTTIQDDQLFLLEETNRLSKRNLEIQDDVLMILEALGG